MSQPKIQAGNSQVKTSAAAATASPGSFALGVESDQQPSSPVFRPSNQMEVSPIFHGTKGELSIEREESTAPPTNFTDIPTQIRSPTVILVEDNEPARAADPEVKVEQIIPETRSKSKSEQLNTRPDDNMDAVRARTSNNMTILTAFPRPQCAFRRAGWRPRKRSRSSGSHFKD